jgi:RimJ/RimL family protein N-acetyltransferase
VVCWRTDNFNLASQRVIERLGAKKDGVIRGNVFRLDGNEHPIGFYKSLGFSECGESLFDLHGEKYRNIHLESATG